MSDTGGWSGRVAFSDSGGFAYRPGELLVDHVRAADVEGRLSPDSRPQQEAPPARDDIEFGFEPPYVRFSGVVDALGAIADLRDEGLPVQPNHVLFSNCGCCGPHPSMIANPFSTNPFSTNPFSTNPFSTNPFSTNPFSTNPFSTNPFHSLADHQPNPVALQSSARSSRAAAAFRATGRRRHSARPATAPQLPAAPTLQDGRAPVVVVVDTGIAEPNLRPAMLTYGVTPRDAPTGVRRTSSEESPDQDQNQRIDPAAGHGTFIAGVIKMIAPHCDIRVQGPITSDGDVCEHDIGLVLESLASDPPDLVNLSFGGYAVSDMPRLASAVRTLQAAGTVIVASAGNDATCRPQYPAAFDGVVAVGALGPWGPAAFTNYGPWVRACAPGVDVVSSFFTEWESPIDSRERYAEWVEWSGTSFAAPAVVGALASAMRSGVSAAQAVERLIDDPALFRVPGLGTVVNQTPRWR